MLADLAASEYDDWVAFASIEPIGMEREDIRAALIAKACTDPYVDQRKHKGGALLSWFIPWGPQPDQPSLSDRIKAAFKQIGARDGE